MKKFLSKLISFIVVFAIVFQISAPLLYAEEAVEAPSQEQVENQSSIDNNNNAEVNNNTNSTSNTGDNTIVPSGSDQTTLGSSPTPSESEPTAAQPEPTPTQEPTPTPIESGQTITPTPTEIQPTPTPESTNEPLDPLSSPVCLSNEQAQASESGAVENSSLENQSSPEENAITCNSTEVVNNNLAEVENNATVSANTGENLQVSENNNSSLNTGNANSETNVENVINTNTTGSEFWTAIINVFATEDNDIDLTSLEVSGSLEENLLYALSQNAKTSDGKINLGLANFISSFSLYNTNTATLTNNIDVIANTGANISDSDINTGNASANLNMFNMVNTNLTGSNWFFGIFNLFNDFNGNIILPYELQFLGEDFDISNLNSSLTSSTLNITNTNDALVNNNVNVLSNSGGNTLIGDGSIDTGNANSSLVLSNIVNTNIVGSNWLFLIVNKFGKWNGGFQNWWGNSFSDSSYSIAFVKLPQIDQLAKASGENSQVQSTETTIENTNSAVVENNVNVTANTGDNVLEGTGDIKTGNAKANANIFNLINTNIIGSNWFFGIVNVFDDFWGDIIFPRPDLAVQKLAEKQYVKPGEEITYILNYKNQGKLWAKNTVVEDSLPSDEEFISASNGGVYSNGKIVWNLGKVLSSQTGSLSIKVKIKSDVPDQKEITNYANISTTTNEPDKTNNDSSSTVKVALDKKDDNGDGGDDSNGDDGEDIGPQGGNGGPPSACNNQKPEKPSSLSGKAGKLQGEVDLSWEFPNPPYDYFLIAYSDNPDAPKWGNPNIGVTDIFTVQELGKGTYYFWVRAGNGCMPGEFAGPVKISLARGSGRAVAQGFSQGVLGKGAMKGSWNKKYIDIGKDEPKLAEQVTQGSSKNWYQLFAEWLRSHSPFGK